MLRIAGQTAGPIGRKFFVDTHGWPEYRLKISEIFFNIFFQLFFPRALQLVIHISLLQPFPPYIRD